MNDNEPLTPTELCMWLEFACWTMVALAPFLYWVNGSAVSTDQFVVRTALVLIALVGGISLRTVKLFNKFKSTKKLVDSSQLESEEAVE